ncbi:MAG: diacylglycerol kinase [gamma proteobacterium symbiont of Bathyaustriella thionipta]|nr:diacylglycerol kinase [gamma proteobacterium symbiont of Bathyaustriella thionipta]
MKNQAFHKKLSYALSGILFTLRTENNFKIQMFIAILILLSLLIIQPTLIWCALIIICIGLVLAAELTNTAIETLLDHLHPEIHSEIGKVKDIMAGMVLILSFMTVLVSVFALADTFELF